MGPPMDDLVIWGSSRPAAISARLSQNARGRDSHNSQRASSAAPGSTMSNSSVWLITNNDWSAL